MAKKPRKPRTPPPPNPVDVPLTDEQLRFVDEYMIDRRSGLAYMRCHPDCRSHRTAQIQGCIIKNLPNVTAEIRSRTRELSVRRRVDSELVVAEIERLAFSDIIDLFDPRTSELRHPRHIPYDARKAIASVKVNRQRRTVTRNGKTRTTVTDQVIEYKLWSKPEALARLCRFLGLETEIPPLEQLLALLPRPLAIQVREYLVQTRTAVPSSNGKH